MKQVKALMKEIQQGNHLDENLIEYKERAYFLYGEYASLELFFSAFLLMEEVQEEKREIAVSNYKILNQIKEAIKQLASGTAKNENLITWMRELRGDITKEMDMLTAYTDRFICYEYILNRMEFRYTDEKMLKKELEEIDENIWMNRLMRFLFSTKDQAVINENLRSVMGQLPIRMTKAKFFERLQETLTLYKGSEKASLDEFLYMVRTSAMLYEPEITEYEQHSCFETILRKLEDCDYVGCKEETFSQLVKELQESAKTIHEITDFYYLLQNIVNQIYAIALCRKNGACGDTISIKAMEILRKVISGKTESEYLIPFEGKIEKYAEESSYFEAALYEVRSSYMEKVEELQLTKSMEELVVVANLLSGSLFIDLEKKVENRIVEEADIKDAAAQLIEEFEVKFNLCSKPVRRAIMAQVAQTFPLGFQNTDQVKECIRQSLFMCQDRAEKMAVIQILNQLIEDR